LGRTHRRINDIINASKSDGHFISRLADAREYAQISLLAKQRHKGRAGTGELLNLWQEFKDTVDRMIRYSKDRNQQAGECTYDPDSVAAALVKLSKSSDVL
jgi:hypothetical protein